MLAAAGAPAHMPPWVTGHDSGGPSRPRLKAAAAGAAMPHGHGNGMLAQE